MSTVIRHSLCRRVFFSHMVGDFRTEHNCNWLIDIIATRQGGKNIKAGNKKDERFKDMQIWRLRPVNDSDKPVDDDGDPMEAVAVVEACADINRNGKAVGCHDRQFLPFTDWDFQANGEPKFYCGPTQVGDEIGQYIFLPSEY